MLILGLVGEVGPDPLKPLGDDACINLGRVFAFHDFQMMLWIPHSKPELPEVASR